MVSLKIEFWVILYVMFANKQGLHLIFWNPYLMIAISPRNLSRGENWQRFGDQFSIKRHSVLVDCDRSGEPYGKMWQAPIVDIIWSISVFFVKQRNFINPQWFNHVFIFDPVLSRHCVYICWSHKEVFGDLIRRILFGVLCPHKHYAIFFEMSDF